MESKNSDFKNDSKTSEDNDLKGKKDSGRSTPELKQEELEEDRFEIRMRRELEYKCREIVNLIESCYFKQEKFVSLYDTWFERRSRRITELKDIVNKMKVLFTSSQIGEMRSIINAGGDWKDVLVTGVMSHLFTSAEERVNCTKEHAIRELSLSITRGYKDDYESVHKVYAQAVQCCTQFSSTRENIENFHKMVKNMETEDLKFVIKNQDDLEFFEEISGLDPLDLDSFYRSVRFCFKKLIKSSSNIFYKRSPKIFRVIDLLPWKFETEGINLTSVGNMYDELKEYFAKPFDYKKTCDKIYDLIEALTLEQKILESIRSDLEILRENN